MVNVNGSHCDKRRKCSNCGDEYAASAKDYYFKLKQDSLEIQTTEKLAMPMQKQNGKPWTAWLDQVVVMQVVTQITLVTKRNTPMSQQLRNIPGAMDISVATQAKGSMIDNATPFNPSKQRTKKSQQTILTSAKEFAAYTR